MALCPFMRSTAWVVNLEEWRHPGATSICSTRIGCREYPQAWLLVPCGTGKDLLEVRAAGQPRTPVEVNWED